ncbi:MAG: SDR family NAD(P)-dependent oxidoreductase [Clostridiales bacterium]|nr:SDR family NAD(P)-dependent oxidoreductase [Clostridiales bacterium]
MKKIENKTILITGATGGLGQTFAKLLCNNNNHLILTSTSEEKINTLISELKDLDNKATITPLICNLLDINSINSVINYLIENKISLDILINNAGYITEGSVENANIETLTNCIQVNCIGTMQLTKKVLDIKKNSQSLRIITIASMAGDYPMPYMATYASTKSFLKNFMLALGYEYRKRNVECLVVQPGAIATSVAMQEAIKAQGLKGKMSAVSPQKIAINSIKKSLKGRKVYTPGVFNKLTKFVSFFAPTTLKMKAISSMWKKSQEKRNIR